MLKRHTVALHYIIIDCNDMLDHIDGVMRALAKKKSQWKEDLYFAAKVLRPKLSKYYAEVTPTAGMLLISAHILETSNKLRSFRNWDKVMDINPEDETFHTTKYQESFLKYVLTKYCAKHRLMSVISPYNVLHSSIIPSAKASGFDQSSFDPNDLSSDYEKYLTPETIAEMTPRLSDCAEPVLTAARLYLDSPPASPQNWGQVNPNLNDYHSDAMEISS